MMHSALLVLHIAVLGYWLGSELVINGLYRFIVRRSDLPVAARQAMTDYLMNADQHVRYALILQATLGTVLLARLALVPSVLGWIAPLAGLVWLALVEVTHRARNTERGALLARGDRALRYMVAAVLVTAALALPDWPVWLRVKLGLFAGVIGCGVLIRFALIRHFAIWGEITASGSTDDRESALHSVYCRATGILAVLWTLIFAIVLLSLFKPG